MRRAVTLGHSVKGEPWSWLGTNCATTVKEVVEAGGQSARTLGPVTPGALFEAFKHPYAVPGNVAITGSHVATPARAVGALDRD
jgi:hypothetical protein